MVCLFMVLKDFKRLVVLGWLIGLIFGNLLQVVWGSTNDDEPEISRNWNSGETPLETILSTLENMSRRSRQSVDGLDITLVGPRTPRNSTNLPAVETSPMMTDPDSPDLPPHVVIMGEHREVHSASNEARK